MRNRLFGSRVRGPFTDCVLRAVFNKRAKSLGAEDSTRTRPPGTSIIIGRKKIKRSLRGLYEARCRRPVFLEIHSLTAGRLIIIGMLVNANGFCGL